MTRKIETMTDLSELAKIIRDQVTAIFMENPRSKRIALTGNLNIIFAAADRLDAIEAGKGA